MTKWTLVLPTGKLCPLIDAVALVMVTYIVVAHSKYQNVRKAIAHARPSKIPVILIKELYVLSY